MNICYKPIVIVVHRASRVDKYDTFKGVLYRLHIPGVNVTYNPMMSRIDVSDYITFIFSSGDVRKLRGMRFELYDCDTATACEYLCMRCVNQNSKPITDIYKFCDELVEAYKKSQSGGSTTLL